MTSSNTHALNAAAPRTMLRVRRKDGSGFVALPAEITFIILEQLVTCADMDNVPSWGTPDLRHPKGSGLRDMLNNRLVCRQFNNSIRPLALEHILVMETHGYLSGKYRSGETIRGDHSAPSLQIQQMISRNEQLPFFGGVRRLTFDLGESNLESPPSPQFAALTVKFLLSLGPSLKELIFALPPGRNGTRSFREAVQIYSTNAGVALENVTTVAPGRLCEFIISLCPNVRRIVSYGIFKDAITLDGMDHQELLVNTATRCSKLEEFEMIAEWDLPLLYFVAGKLSGLRTLGLLGEMTDYIAVTRVHEFDYLLARMPDLKTLILPKQTVDHIFVRREYLVVGSSNIPPTSPLAVPEDMLYSWNFVDDFSLHTGATKNWMFRDIKKRYGYAYEFLTEHVMRLCPQLETIWLDFTRRSRAQYNSWENARDLRIRVVRNTAPDVVYNGTPEDGVQIETSWAHLRSVPSDEKALLTSVSIPWP